MTTPKSSHRKRRPTKTGGIPKFIKEWFAGTRHFSFQAYMHPWTANLPEYWAAWKESHPDAVMPETLPRLIEQAHAFRRFKELNGKKSKEV